MCDRFPVAMSWEKVTYDPYDRMADARTLPCMIRSMGITDCVMGAWLDMDEEAVEYKSDRLELLWDSLPEPVIRQIIDWNADHNEDFLRKHFNRWWGVPDEE